MWGGGVNAADRNAAYQMRVKDGVAQTRTGDGEWRADDKAVPGLAPDGDFLAFIDVAKNI